MTDSEWKEANVAVNGNSLSVAESMTLRVAISQFLMTLQDEGLGDDQMGRDICAGYKSAARSILQKMTTGMDG